MTTLYAFTIPPEYAPFVAPLGLLIGACLGLIGVGFGIVGTLLSQRWRNQHEVNQKQADFREAREVAFLKEKSAAADAVIKKISLRLQYFIMLEDFFGDILNARGTEEIISLHARHYGNELAENIKQHKEAQLQSIQSFHTFFDKDVDTDAEEEKYKQRDNVFEDELRTFDEAYDNVTQLYQMLPDTMDDTPEEIENIKVEHSAAVGQMLRTAQTLLAMTKEYIREHRKTTLNIGQQKTIVTPL